MGQFSVEIRPLPGSVLGGNQHVSFEGDMLRIYARIYARDLYLYGYSGADEIPEMETVFVLSLGTGDENDDVYNELRDQLGAFVEAAVVETDIDVDNEGF